MAHPSWLALSDWCEQQGAPAAAISIVLIEVVGRFTVGGYLVRMAAHGHAHPTTLSTSRSAPCESQMPFGVQVHWQRPLLTFV